MKKMTIKSIREMFICGSLLGCSLLLMSCGGISVDNAESRSYENIDVVDTSSSGKKAESHRKIIYEASMELIVQEFSLVEKTLPSLVKEHGGYLSKVSVDRASGEHRYGSWEARIPVDQFDLFRNAVSKMGVVESQSETAQDVTDQFVDLKARIDNKKKLEERIIELLEDKKGKISDIIEVERELARVRSEIEQMEGRMRYLKNRTDMSTIKIMVREKKNYVPPKAPTFMTKITRSWEKSFLSLRVFAEELIIIMVYLLPWLIILLVVGLPAIWLKRRSRSGKADQQADSKKP